MLCRQEIDTYYAKLLAQAKEAQRARIEQLQREVCNATCMPYNHMYVLHVRCPCLLLWIERLRTLVCLSLTCVPLVCATLVSLPVVSVMLVCVTQTTICDSGSISVFVTCVTTATSQVDELTELVQSYMQSAEAKDLVIANLKEDLEKEVRPCTTN